MLTLTECNFNRHPHLINPVDVEKITEDGVRYFDKDGFELCSLEHDFYIANDVQIHNVLNHSCDQQDWFVCSDANFKLDHSLLLQRWDFQKEARDQLQTFKKQYPQLIKLQKIIPKWGIDFALDYFKDDVFLEVLHIETDYRSYEEAMEAKEALTHKILNTDWNDFVESILHYKNKWDCLVGFQQNDWKAVHWGLTKAEITEKVYA